MAQPRLQRGRWSTVTEFIYVNLSNKGRLPLQPALDLRRIRLEEYLITPSVGYLDYDFGEDWPLKTITPNGSPPSFIPRFSPKALA